MADPAGTEFLDNARIGEVGYDHAQHRRAEYERKALPGMEMLTDQLLRGIEETEQRAEHQRAANDIANRIAPYQCGAHIAQDRAWFDVLLVLRVERFGQPQPHPQPDDDPHDRHRPENRAPAEEIEDDLADGRRDQRHGEEDHHYQAHQAGHAVAADPVAHNRRRHHAQPGAEQPLHQSQADQPLETRCDRTGRRENDIDDQAECQHGPPSEAVGKGAGEERPDPGAEEIGPDHELALIAASAEFIGNRSKRGQHRVDAESLQAHQQCHQHDQLALAQFVGGVSEKTLHHTALRIAPPLGQTFLHCTRNA